MAEFAVILPLVMLLIFGLIFGGFGIFRYHHLASLSREGARYASVYGGQFEREHPQFAAATAEDVYSKAILPKSGGLQSSRLSYNVTWAHPNKQPLYYDHAIGEWRRNIVSVTVSYDWVPEMFFRPVTLSSTSTMPVTY